MKNLKSYIAGFLALVAATVGFSSCQDHFDDPSGVNTPVAAKQANTTIAEIKDLMWSDDANYCDTVPTKDNGEHYIIAGRVISSDYAGNCFKYIILQDETAALTISINSYNLYLMYRRGQEVVVDLTGLHVGKYRGLLQVGFPSYNSSIPGYETSFLSPERFFLHAELNGMPEVAKIDTLVVNKFSEIGVTPSEIKKWQSQIVRFNNVQFVANDETPTFSTYHSSGVTQQISDSDGNTLDVRTSGYSNFWNQKMPEGRCDVIALMGYYMNLANTGGWQLTLIDANSWQNVGNPTEAKGTKNNPYDVLQAIAAQVNSEDVNGWVKGYMVGTVAPEIETVSSNADIEWTAEPTLKNTLVIGQTADTKDLAECVVVELKSGSDLQRLAALRENPDNYGKEILIKGEFAPVMGTHGITKNNGTISEFSIDGKATPGEPVTEGDGSAEKPYSVGQVVAMGADASKTGVWVSGYIVGSVPDKYFSDAILGTESASATNIIIANSPSETDVNKCIPVQLPAGSVRDALSLATKPENLGKLVSLKGDIAKYFSVAGFKNTSEYVFGDGGNSENPPVDELVSALNENFAGGIPANWKQVQISGDKAWYKTDYNGTAYAAMTGYKGTKPPYDAWLVTPGIDMSKVSDKALSFCTQVNGYGSKTSKFEVYVMTQADTKGTNTNLNPTIAVAPASGYSGWTESGKIDLSAYSGTIYIGFRYYATEDANYATWCVTDVKLGAAGSDTPDDPVTPPAGGAGSEAEPYNVAQIIAMGPDAAQTAVFVKGYIVGSCTGKDFASATFTADGASNTNVLIADNASCTDAAKCIPVQLPSGDVRTALSLQQHPENLGKQVLLGGDIAKYFSQPGFKNTSSYKWVDGSDTPTDPDTPDNPVTPAGDYKGDFNTFNGGEAKASPYGTYTNSTGWTTANCVILSGLAEGGTEQNPRFAFIGDESTLAPTLNGKVSTPGSITSPVLAGGCGTLTFNYGFAFSEKAGTSFKVEILQGGVVVKEDVVTVGADVYAQKTVYNYSFAVNVSGEFQIVITNLCAGEFEANKERVSIWNLTWTE